jgi:hypothetical protein
MPKSLLILKQLIGQRPEHRVESELSVNDLIVFYQRYRGHPTHLIERHGAGGYAISFSRTKEPAHHE